MRAWIAYTDGTMGLSLRDGSRADDLIKGQ
jgi:hypothetical protein